MLTQQGSGEESETLGSVQLWINVFGPCTLIGRALNLCVDLPDLTDKAQTEALWQLPGNTWKQPFEGAVADTMRDGDHDWMRLADYPFGVAYFDLEEGVKFYTTIGKLGQCLTFIVSLTDHGVPLVARDFMGGSEDESGCCVWVSPQIYGTPDPEPIFKKIGLIPNRPNGRPPWVLPPNWSLPTGWSVS